MLEACLLRVKFTINTHYRKHFPFGFFVTAENLSGTISTQDCGLEESHATPRIKEAQNRNLLRSEIKNQGCADKRKMLKLKRRQVEVGGKPTTSRSFL